MKKNTSPTSVPVWKNTGAIIFFLLFLLLSYLITTMGLMLLAFLLFKISLNESVVSVGIILIYIISNFLAAFICGKKCKGKKFLWGLGIGSVYFAVLILLSLLMSGSVVGLGSGLLTTFLICAGSGMLGGMLAASCTHATT